MFVPSLSWQNVRFYIEMAQKCRFPQDFGSYEMVRQSLNELGVFKTPLLRHLYIYI
jgi:hypothetical protein